MIFWMNLIDPFCSLHTVLRCSSSCYWVAALLWHSNSMFRPKAHLLDLIALSPPTPFKTTLLHHTTSPPLHTLHRLRPYAPGQQSQLLQWQPMAFLTAQRPPCCRTFQLFVEEIDIRMQQLNRLLWSTIWTGNFHSSAGQCEGIKVFLAEYTRPLSLQHQSPHLSSFFRLLSSLNLTIVTSSLKISCLALQCKSKEPLLTRDEHQLPANYPTRLSLRYQAVSDRLFREWKLLSLQTGYHALGSHGSQILLILDFLDRNPTFWAARYFNQLLRYQALWRS